MKQYTSDKQPQNVYTLLGLTNYKDERGKQRQAVIIQPENASNSTITLDYGLFLDTYTLIH